MRLKLYSWTCPESSGISNPALAHFHAESRPRRRWLRNRWWIPDSSPGVRGGAACAGQLYAHAARLRLRAHGPDAALHSAEQIIKQFAAKETEFQEALNHYTYRRVARVETIDDDTNKVDGEWYEVDDVIFDPGGARTEKVVFAPPNTLTRVMMSPSDLQDIQHGYPFVLTTADLPEYDVKYVGRQKVDELDCYVFDVSPKVIEKNKRYLDGRIWVDATDLQIVVTNGRMVPDDTKQGPGRSASALHDLAAAGRRPLLVPGLHQGRGHSALHRRQRLHGAGRAYPRHGQIHRLQALRLDHHDHLTTARTLPRTASRMGASRLQRRLTRTRSRRAHGYGCAPWCWNRLRVGQGRGLVGLARCLNFSGVPRVAASPVLHGAVDSFWAVDSYNTVDY